MKKQIFLSGFLLFVLSQPCLAFDPDLGSDSCHCNVPFAGYATDNLAEFAAGALRISKKTFKKREPSNLRKLVAIESDFRVPPVVGDNWWGNIYIDPATNTLRYRDETIADSYYQKEIENPGHRLSNVPFKANDVNTGAGLILLNEHGAYVSVKSAGRAFNARSGGPVVFSFKSPGGEPAKVQMNIAINNGRVTNSVVTPAGPVVFDTLKVRTGFTGILGGVSKIEFRRNGQLVYTLDT